MLIYELPADPSRKEILLSKTPSSSGARPKSSRLRQKIDTTYAYFSSKVDPLIATCVANFLFRQPVDVFNSMKFYFLHIRKGLGDNCFGKVECHRTKMHNKKYFAEHLSPVLSLVVDLITTSQPFDVVEFICGQFITNKVLSDSCGNTASKVEIFTRNLSPMRRVSTISKPLPSDIESDLAKSAEAAVTSALSKAKAEASLTVQSKHQAACNAISTLINGVPMRIQICVLGDVGSGKTSILNALQGNFDRTPKPSLGFKPTSMQVRENVDVTFYDLGGGRKIRNIWSEYYHDAHAVLYVFDASLKGEELEDSIALFQSTIMNSFLANKPLLILANKQDKGGVLSASQLAAFLDLRGYSNSGYLVAECVSFTNNEESDMEASPGEISSMQGSAPEFSVDRRLETALESFLESIQENYTALDSRVGSDIKAKKDIELKKRFERERKVLRNKIASAFRKSIDPSSLPENLSDPSPDDSFTEAEGIAFIAGEIGTDSECLDEAALEIIRLVGYQRLAMQIVGALKSPINQKKVPMSWPEIKALVIELRTELGLP